MLYLPLTIDDLYGKFRPSSSLIAFWKMDLLTLILSCAPAVESSTMAALLQAESNGHPYAIHDNHTGHSHAPNDPAAAVQLAKQLFAQGHSLDVGLGQINTDNFERLGLNFESAFDPCRNLAASAEVLTTDFERTNPNHSLSVRLVETLSRYNTGSPTRGVRNGYVERVIKAAEPPVIPPISVLTPDSSSDPSIIQNSPDHFDLMPDGFE